MKSSADIARQIDQLTRELKDIENSLPVIYEKGTNDEQEDAEVRLVACQNRLKRLQAHLATAQQEEAAAAERARYRANEDAQAEARAAFEDVIDRLNAKRSEIIRAMTTASDEIDPLYSEIRRLQNEFLEAWLANNPEQRRGDSFLWPKLSSPPLDLTGPEKHASDALLVLYASRNNLPGSYESLMADSAAQGAQRFMAGYRPQQQLSDPMTPVADALDFLDRRANGGDD